MAEDNIEGRLAKVEAVVVGVQHDVTAIKEDTGKIEAHLRALNGTVASMVAWRWWLTGAAAALTFIVVVFGALVVGIVIANS